MLIIHFSSHELCLRKGRTRHVCARSRWMASQLVYLLALLTTLCLIGLTRGQDCLEKHIQWPLKIGAENAETGAIDIFTTVEDVDSVSNYLVVTLNSLDPVVVGTNGAISSAKSVALYDTTTAAWLFVRSFPNQAPSQPMYATFHYEDKLVATAFSYVDSNSHQHLAVATILVDAPYTTTGMKYVKVDGVSTEMVYNLQKSGFVSNTTQFIYLAVNYTLNETVPGANEDGTRRFALLRFSNDKSAGYALSASSGKHKFFKVQTKNWLTVVGASLFLYKDGHQFRSLFLCYTSNEGQGFVVRYDHAGTQELNNYAVGIQFENSPRTLNNRDSAMFEPFRC